MVRSSPFHFPRLSSHSFIMFNLLSLIILTLSLSTDANGASIGPTALLTISNANVSLDGFTRPWVHIAGIELPP